MKRKKDTIYCQLCFEALVKPLKDWAVDLTNALFIAHIIEFHYRNKHSGVWIKVLKRQNAFNWVNLVTTDLPLDNLKPIRASKEAKEKE